MQFFILTTPPSHTVRRWLYCLCGMGMMLCALHTMPILCTPHKTTSEPLSVNISCAYFTGYNSAINNSAQERLASDTTAAKQRLRAKSQPPNTSQAPHKAQPSSIQQQMTAQQPEKSSATQKPFAISPAELISVTTAVVIGSRRELFVDSLLIDRMHNARLQASEPREEEIAFAFEQPWEGALSAYTTILTDTTTSKRRFRAYYRGGTVVGSTNTQVTCYAESYDGIQWHKPALSGHLATRFYHRTDSAQSAISLPHASNIVLVDDEAFTHNFTPMLDPRPDVPSAERFKALAGNDATGLFAFVSTDGIKWHKLDSSAVIRVGAFDSQNVSFWSSDEEQYVCYLRVYDNGVRRVARAVSKDYRTWSPPVMMTYTNVSAGSALTTATQENIYVNQTQPYPRAPHLYIGLAGRIFIGKQALTLEQIQQTGVALDYAFDCSEPVLLTTRAGTTSYQRQFMEAFVPPTMDTRTWTSRSNFPVCGIIQTSPTELSFFVHRNYAQPNAHLRRYSLRLDGFGALTAPYAGGECLTKPLIFSGRQLVLNMATSAAGSVKVELQSADSIPIVSYTAADAQELVGNSIERVVVWRAPDLSPLIGKPVRIRFIMRDAKIYSFQFR